MRRAHRVSALIGAGAICAAAAIVGPAAAAPASAAIPSGVYAGTIDLPYPFARFRDQPLTLSVSPSRRVVHFPRFRVNVDCAHGYFSWWTYVLPALHPRAGRFQAHRRIARVRDGHPWRTALDLRGHIVPGPVPGITGRLRATIWVPRTAAGGPQACRTGFRRFSMTTTAGAPTAHGALRQLPGPAGCVTPHGRHGCTPARGAFGTTLAISSDGRHLYTSGSDGVYGFSRDLQTGALTPLEGSSSCVNVTGDRGCAVATRMRGPDRGLALSPDGTSLYVTWEDLSTPGEYRNGLSVLRRDPATGGLSELEAEGGCLDNRGTDGCTPWRLLVGDTDSIAASPDGRHLYVGAQGLGSALGEPRVALLHVDPATGGLRPPDPAGCPGLLDDPEPASSCAPFAGSSIVTFASGSRHLYTADRVLSRDPETGLLRPVAGRRGCYVVPDRDDPLPEEAFCTPLWAFFGYVEGVVASPDGRDLYMADEGTAVGGLRRNPVTGRLSPIRVLGGCARSGAGAGCSHSRAFDGPNGLSMAPDGRTVYVGGYQSDSIAVFNRDGRTGALWQLAGPNGCVSGGNRRENETLSCSPGRTLRFPWDLALSPDGRNLYALTDEGIAVFAVRAG